MLGLDAAQLVDPLRADVGGMWETFVANELLRHASWSSDVARIGHVRAQGGRHEVDLIAELRDGRIVAIEVKRTPSPSKSSFGGLAWLRDRIGDRFAHGVVLCRTPEVLPFGDRLTAAPLSTLWA